MTIMSDKWIKKMSLEQDMISPFVDGQKKDGTISYGVSSYGYDARVSEEFKIYWKITESLIFRVSRNFAEILQKITNPADNYRKITGKMRFPAISHAFSYFSYNCSQISEKLEKSGFRNFRVICFTISTENTENTPLGRTPPP